MVNIVVALGLALCCSVTSRSVSGTLGACRQSWSRRGFLALTRRGGGAGRRLQLDKPGTVADDGSVTVKHAFGETKIPAPPKRVVSAGFTGQDDLLALGVVPIAVTDWFGGEPFGVWPWAQPKLGGAQPACSASPTASRSTRSPRSNPT